MVSDALVPRLLGPRGLGRLLWRLQHVAKDCSLGQARQEAEKAVLLLDREDELIPTHVPSLPTPYSRPHLQRILEPGPQCFNSWCNPRSFDTKLCLVEKIDDIVFGGKKDDTNLLHECSLVGMPTACQLYCQFLQHRKEN